MKLMSIFNDNNIFNFLDDLFNNPSSKITEVHITDRANKNITLSARLVDSQLKLADGRYALFDVQILEEINKAGAYYIQLTKTAHIIDTCIDSISTAFDRSFGYLCTFSSELEVCINKCRRLVDIFSKYEIEFVFSYTNFSGFIINEKSIAQLDELLVGLNEILGSKVYSTALDWYTAIHTFISEHTIESIMENPIADEKLQKKDLKIDVITMKLYNSTYKKALLVNGELVPILTSSDNRMSLCIQYLMGDDSVGTAIKDNKIKKILNATRKKFNLIGNSQ